MDAFLLNLYTVCYELLPVLGVVALIVLIVALIKLAKLLGTVDVTLNKTHPSITLVERTLDKAQGPVDTVVKVSKSVDKAHDASVKAIDGARDYVVKNVEVIKEKINELALKEAEKGEIKEPNPDDSLKGE